VVSEAKVLELRTKEGRIARVSPNGAFIQHDEFVPVPVTPYVQRLIDVHQDVEVKPVEEAPATPPPAPKKKES
jgi:hypothetical protein